MTDPISRLAHAWLERGRRKRFAGNLFDRFHGLEPVLARCAGATVLDIGSCDGLIAYELARAGARTLHGFEVDGGDVAFARRLFRDVPADATFVEVNLKSGVSALEPHAELMLERYDIVLYLGVHQHLARQMDEQALDGMVRFLADRTAKLFALRTKSLDDVEPVLRECGLERIADAEGAGDVGPLRIYERKPEPS